MKYVRTIEEPNKIHEVAWVSCGFIGFLDEKNGCDQSHIYKQADTIEELGDTYVIVPKDKKYKPYTINTLSVFDDFEDVLRHSDIYLSIWVDALLKPVAKMNEKRELELL